MTLGLERQRDNQLSGHMQSTALGASKSSCCLLGVLSSFLLLPSELHGGHISIRQTSSSLLFPDICFIETIPRAKRRKRQERCEVEDMLISWTVVIAARRGSAPDRQVLHL